MVCSPLLQKEACLLSYYHILEPSITLTSITAPLQKKQRNYFLLPKLSERVTGHSLRSLAFDQNYYFNFNCTLKSEREGFDFWVLKCTWFLESYQLFFNIPKWKPSFLIWEGGSIKVTIIMQPWFILIRNLLTC